MVIPLPTRTFCAALCSLFVVGLTLWSPLAQAMPTLPPTPPAPAPGSKASRAKATPAPTGPLTAETLAAAVPSYAPKALYIEFPAEFSQGPMLPPLLSEEEILKAHAAAQPALTAPSGGNPAEAPAPADPAALAALAEPAPAPLVYQIRGAFLAKSRAATLPLPTKTDRVRRLLPALENPYATFLLSLYLDKTGDIPGRLRLVKPEEEDRLFVQLSNPEFAERTHRFFANVEAVRLLLAVELNERVYIYYTLKNAPGAPADKTVYIRAFVKHEGRYLVDVARISNPALINILGLLQSQGADRIIIRSTPPTPVAAPAPPAL